MFKSTVLAAALLVTAGCATEPRQYVTTTGTGAVQLYRECLSHFKPVAGMSEYEIRGYELEWRRMCLNGAQGLQADNQAILNNMGMALILQNQYQQQLQQQHYKGF